MAQNIREMNSAVMDMLGLDDGFRIPVANEENKQLENKYIEFQRQKTNLKLELGEQNDRVQDILNHLKNVTNEISSCQALLQAKSKELNTETSITKVHSREYEKIEKEIAEVNKRLQDLKEKENSCENSMFKLNQQIEEKKQQMDWDQQTLESWLEECKKKDENAMFLEKYSRQDESKIKELSLKISNLTEECLSVNKKLDTEAIETQTAQYGLDKIANEYRKAHEERQNLIQRWQNTLEQLQNKDGDIDELALKITETKREIKLKENEVKEKEEFLITERKSNEDFEIKIKMFEAMQSRKRQNLLEVEGTKDAVLSELITLKQELEKTASDLESCRSQVKSLKKEIYVKNEKLEDMKAHVEELKNQEKQQKDSVMSAEMRTKKMEQLMEEEEKMQRKLEEEMKSLNIILYKKQQVVLELSTKKKNLEADIQSTQVTIRNLLNRTDRLDQEAMKQTKLLYNQDFSLQEMNKKLGRLQGEVSMEEKSVYETKLKELTEQLEEKKKSHQYVLGQHQQLSEDIKRLKNECDKIKDTKNDFAKKAQELELKIETAGKALKEIINQKQDRAVHENFKKLEIKRLRNFLFKKANDNISIEKDLVMMKAAMEERKEEIMSHRGLLVSQLKMLDDEMRRTTMEVQEKISKIDQLKKRYEIVVMKMAPFEGEKSVTSYIIKATQEKEELQSRGDQLNAEIISKERELKAFENTILLIAGRNEVQRTVICRGSSSGEEPEKQELEEKFKTIAQMLKQKKNDCGSFQEEIEELDSTLQTIRKEKYFLSEDFDRKQQELSKSKKELADQQTKLQRVNKMNSKLFRDVSSSGKINCTEEELDIGIKELKTLNNLVAKEINSTVQNYPMMMSSVQKLFEQANLQLPSSSNPHLSRSPSLLSLRSSQMMSPKPASFRGDSPKVSSVSVTIQDVVLPLQDKPKSRTASKSSHRSSTSSVRSATNRK